MATQANAFDLSSQTAIQQGRYTHRVPLELPPAPRGLVPDLALVADHGVTDGPVGPGWALTGFSRIERRGEHGGTPAFDATDTFYIDGQQLYWTAGPSQAGYRQELDDNRIFYRQSGDGQNYWTAQRDGWTWTFGEFEHGGSLVGHCATESPGESYPCDDNPGEALAETQSTAWLLSRVEDPAGNIIDFEYTGEAGFSTGTPEDWIADARASHQPSRVVYGDGYVEVRFSWESREDTSFAMRGGTPWVVAARLTAIDIGTRDGTSYPSVGGYGLHWLNDDVAAGIGCDGETLPDAADAYGSFLHRISRVGSDASERALRCMEVDTSPTTFGPDNTGSTYSTGPDPVTFVTFPNDFDGDAHANLSSLRYESPGGATWTLGSCDVPVLCELDSSLVDQGFFGVGDLDGDGLTDVYALTDRSLDATLPAGQTSVRRVYERDGVIYDTSDLYGTAYVPDPYDLPDATLADINGDGRADLVTKYGYYPNRGEPPGS